MTIRFLIFLISAAAVALLASGCGGSDGDATAAPPLSKAEFLKQGDKICRKADKAQELALGPYLKQNAAALKSKSGQEDLVLTIGLPAIEEAVEKLEALGVPTGDEDRVETIFEAMHEGIEALKEEPLNATIPAKNPFAEADKLAAGYGFKNCDESL